MINEIKVDDNEYKLMYEVEETHWWYSGLRDVLYYWIKKLNVKKILDAGCGTGINMYYLVKSGYEVKGIDVSDQALEFCKSRGLNNVEKSSIQNIPLNDQSVDCVYSMDVIAMLPIEDVVKAFNEISRVLKPKGYLILNTAALTQLYSSHDIAWHVKHRYTKSELEKLLIVADYKIIFSTYRIFLMFPAVALIKLLEKTKTQSDIDKTNRAINLLLSPIMKIEFYLQKIVSLPIGSSLFVVAQKNK